MSTPTKTAGTTFITHGEDAYQLTQFGGGVVYWLDANGDVNTAGGINANGMITSNAGVNSNGGINLAGNAGMGPLITLQDTNPNLGLNQYDVIALYKNPTGLFPPAAVETIMYGDGSFAIETFTNSVFKSGIQLDVTDDGEFNGFNSDTAVAVGVFGSAGFCSSGFNPSRLIVQENMGDLMNGIPPNPGEVSWTVNGKQQVYQGTAVPIANYGANNVQPVIVAAFDGPLTAGALSTAVIFSTNGPLTISSATVTSGTVTITTNQNLPSCWMTGILVNITGIAGTGNWNGTNIPITVTGAKTFTYTSNATGSATVSQGVVMPVNGAMTATNFVINNSANNSYIQSVAHSAGNATITLNGSGLDSQMITGKVIIVSGIQGDTSLNGIWVITSSSGIGGGAMVYPVAGSGSPTLGATGTAFVTIPKFYMGEGQYKLEGMIVAETAGSGNTATVTLTYTDNSGLTSKTQTASGTFQSQGDTVSWSFLFSAAQASDIKIAISHSGTPPPMYDYHYRLIIF